MKNTYNHSVITTAFSVKGRGPNCHWKKKKTGRKFEKFPFILLTWPMLTMALFSYSLN
jgi:hypothetical protein